MRLASEAACSLKAKRISQHSCWKNLEKFSFCNFSLLGNRMPNCDLFDQFAGDRPGGPAFTSPPPACHNRATRMASQVDSKDYPATLLARLINQCPTRLIHQGLSSNVHQGLSSKAPCNDFPARLLTSCCSGSPRRAGGWTSSSQGWPACST